MISVAIPLAAYAYQEPEPRIHIALGDSVSAGFGVDDTTRYTALFSEMLKQRDYINKYVNMAEDGFTSAMLLNFLNNIDEYSLSHFQDAYVITLNIGGNDILTPLISYLPTPEDAASMVSELWEFIHEAMAIVPEVRGVATEFQDALDNLNLWRVWEIPALNRMVQSAMPVLGDVTSLFDRVDNLQLVQLLPLLSGEFSPELEAALTTGAAAFEDNFNEILAWLSIHAPEAVIIVNTVYNPVPNQLLGMSLEGLSYRANELIVFINGTILEGSEAKGYLVADVYTGFASEPDSIMNFFMDTTALTFSFDIIHPNAAGHELIAGLNYELFNTR